MQLSTRFLPAERSHEGPAGNGNALLRGVPFVEKINDSLRQEKNMAAAEKHVDKKADCKGWVFPARHWQLLKGCLLFPLILVVCQQAHAKKENPRDASCQPDRPNIVLIMVDDMGYSDLGCFGGEIETPHLDRLAGHGLRFTQFYNQGRCCPTRASLLTGLQPHQVGIGHMTAPPNQPLGFTGPYQGYLNDNCTTLAERLREAGYQTLMTGKWHLGSDRKECWPLQRGFDRFYGCLSGAINYFQPGGNRGIHEGNQPVTTPAGWYATDAFTDRAIEYLQDARQSSEKPFFLYLAYNAPHWPLNAKWQDYLKYRERYDSGWNVLMKRRQAKQEQIGLFPGGTRPAPFPGPEWDSLGATQQKRLSQVMAAYAGCVDSIDQNIGKLVQHLNSTAELDNTLILFLSDNGACQEGGNFGKGDEKMIKTPPLETVAGVRLGLHWAGACNTPFRKYKHFVHEGGACTPLIAHWPAAIQDRRGDFVRQAASLQDIMATFVEVSGGEYPSDLPPCRGKSLMPLLRGSRQPLHPEPLYWEHEGNAAVREGKWKLVREYQKPWELYDLSTDRTELNDLAQKQPEVRDRLVAQWKNWATNHSVSFPERFDMYQHLRELKKKNRKD